MKTMGKIICASVITFAAVAIGGQAFVRTNTPPPSGETVAQLNSAAYRDGAFQAELTRKNGGERHLSVGRWSSPADRQLFVAGYEDRLGGMVDSLNYQGQ